MSDNCCVYVVEIKGKQYVEYKAYERRVDDLCRQIAELESELEVKENLLKIKNGLCKPPMMTVIVAKTINGQDYVKLEDFMSVVHNLQNYSSDRTE